MRNVDGHGAQKLESGSHNGTLGRCSLRACQDVDVHVVLHT